MGDSENSEPSSILPTLQEMEQVNTRYDVEKKEEFSLQLWKQVFPFEILFCRIMATNATVVKLWNIFFLIITITLLIYIFILVNDHNYVSDDIPLSLTVLLNFEGVIILFIPYICFWFSKNIMSNPDLNALITFAIKHDPYVRMKFAFFTHLNFFCLVTAFSIYSIGENVGHIIIVFITSMLYFGPLTIAVSLSVCVVELHRIKIQQLRQHINEKQCRLDALFWGQHDGVDINTAAASHHISTTSVNCMHEGISDGLENDIPPTETKLSREQYYQMYAICARSSCGYGLYLLFFISFGFLYAFAMIYGIYLGQYPNAGIVGFVLVGLFMVLELAWALTACNETGWCQQLYTILFCSLLI